MGLPGRRGAEVVETEGSGVLASRYIEVTISASQARSPLSIAMDRHSRSIWRLVAIRSASSFSVTGATTAPRWVCASTRPSLDSRISASRIGVSPSWNFDCRSLARSRCRASAPMQDLGTQFQVGALRLGGGVAVLVKEGGLQINLEFCIDTMIL